MNTTYLKTLFASCIALALAAAPIQAASLNVTSFDGAGTHGVTDVFGTDLPVNTGIVAVGYFATLSQAAVLTKNLSDLPELFADFVVFGDNTDIDTTNATGSTTDDGAAGALDTVDASHKIGTAGANTPYGEIGPNFGFAGGFSYNVNGQLLASPPVGANVYTFIGNNATFGGSNQFLLYDHDEPFTVEFPGGPSPLSISVSQNNAQGGIVGDIGLPFGTFNSTVGGQLPSSSAFSLNIVPEPSRGLLAFVAISACVLRRRR